MKVILVLVVLAEMFAPNKPAYAQNAPIAGHSDNGALVFKKCMPCHQVGLDAKNGVGPVLNGVVGRAAGSYLNYNYSPATKNSGLLWDEQTLTRYLRAPRDLVPGTRMSFIGLKKDQKIADVIAYLKQFNAGGKQADRYFRLDNSADVVR